MKHTLQLIDTLIETGDEATFSQIFFDNSFTLNKPDKEQDCNCSEDDDDSNSNNAKILTDIENFMMSSPVQIERSWINKYLLLKNYKSSMSNYAQSQPMSSWKHYQRKQFQLMKNGEKSSMTADRLKLLRGIGFDFNERSDAAKPSSENDNKDSSILRKRKYSDISKISDTSIFEFPIAHRSTPQAFCRVSLQNKSSKMRRRTREDVVEDGEAIMKSMLNDVNVTRYTTDYTLYILAQLLICKPNLRKDQNYTNDSKENGEGCSVCCRHCLVRTFSFRHQTGFMRSFTKSIAHHFEVNISYFIFLIFSSKFQ